MAVDFPNPLSFECSVVGSTVGHLVQFYVNDAVCSFQGHVVLIIFLVTTQYSPNSSLAMHPGCVFVVCTAFVNSNHLQQKMGRLCACANVLLSFSRHLATEADTCPGGGDNPPPPFPKKRMINPPTHP